MKPVSPVVEGLEQFEFQFGKDQPEYSPLICLVGSLPERCIVSRWELTDEERALIAAGCDVYTGQMTFGDCFQPLKVFVGTPKMDSKHFMEVYGIGHVVPTENISVESLDKLLR